MPLSASFANWWHEGFFLALMFVLGVLYIRALIGWAREIDREREGRRVP